MAGAMRILFCFRSLYLLFYDFPAVITAAIRTDGMRKARMSAILAQGNRRRLERMM